MTRTVHPPPPGAAPPTTTLWALAPALTIVGPDRPAQGSGPRIAEMDGELSSFWIVVIHHL